MNQAERALRWIDRFVVPLTCLMAVMTHLDRGSMKSTILVATLLGFGCGLVVLGVSALWWWTGQDSVSCYYASYDPDTERVFGEMAAKMWPTRWLWIGLIVAPTLAGALFGFVAARLGLRVGRRGR